MFLHKESAGYRRYQILCFMMLYDSVICCLIINYTFEMNCTSFQSNNAVDSIRIVFHTVGSLRNVREPNLGHGLI